MVFRSYTPKWTYLLILFGVLPFAIVAAVLQKRVKAPAWPFCQECGRLRTRRLLIGVGLVVFAILAAVVAAAVLPDDGSAAGPATLLFVLMIIAGLGIAGTAGYGPVASGYVSNDGQTVHFRRAHERFAAQAADMRSAVEQQWAAQQQWQQPSHGQAWPAQQPPAQDWQTPQQPPAQGWPTQQPPPQTWQGQPQGPQRP
ncbi:hypothetical protein DLE60_22645 [Micromonospora globispora]|uniref:Uncharacterized protein n=1 Tax=Micromonospora globispora TaxID=1450148 RepID=A0A317JS94_9ACTN|nr:hypothetical protein DLJ46_32490 [Micromonospora globispora]PWU58274.1 hypothetical protein DLE60_22645 [Micromonospora globispora]